MPSLHEVATITSKGQITLPKSIRRMLGVDTGDKVIFQRVGSQIVVSRIATPEHHDPAIAGFLALLEKDIRNGQQLTGLPDDLADAMLATLQQPFDLDDEITGEVAL